MTAQVDLTDQNWNLIFHDDFNDQGRGWSNNTFYELGHPNILWMCKSAGNTCPVMSGNPTIKKHIYQPSQCIFSDGTIKLVAQYENAYLSCYNGDYIIPSDITCDNCTQTDKQYFTGQIRTLSKFSYGYFEIRCKLPIHPGVHTAFWLFGGGPSSYEEIDIVEYSKHDSNNYSARSFSSGIHHNPNSASYEGSQKYCDSIFTMPNSEFDVRQFHTYGCEWMPNYIKWYCDGILVNEYREREHIPRYNKRVIVSYTIDKINENNSLWYGSDTLTIDYVKIYQMKTDCDSEILITTGNQIANFVQKMRKSVTIGTSETDISVPTNTNVSIHAEDHITLNGVIEIPIGVNLTLSTHECPENTNSSSQTTN